MTLDIKRHVASVHLFDKSLKEMKKHGTDDLPVQFYETSFTNFDEFYTHWHSEIEIIYIVSGKINVKINHQSFDIEKNQFVVISKGALHSIHKHSLANENTKFITLIFDLNMLSSLNREYTQKELIEKVDNQQYFINRIISTTDDIYNSIYSLFFQIYATFKKKELYYQIEIKGLLHLLIANILKQKNPITIEIKSRPKINISKVIDVITTNLDKQFTIEGLAKTVRYSEAYLMREFKKATNSTIFEFINKQKIERAKIMLTSTEDNVSLIAYKSGYNNVNYFIKKFKQYVGTTPFDYRKAQRS